MKNQEIICTICARAGSKGVRDKNIREIAGKPLIAHSIQQALNSGLFEHVVVSTDSDAIIEVAKQYGAEVLFKRPAELASDTAGKLEVIRHAFLFCEEYFGKHYVHHVDLDATSPLRRSNDIIEAYKKFRDENYEILITGAPSRRSPYFNLVEEDENHRVTLSKQLGKNVLRRQDVPQSYDMNASIYIWERDALVNQNSLFFGNTGIYVMPEDRSYDIDSELDFRIVEMLMEERNDE